MAKKGWFGHVRSGFGQDESVFKAFAIQRAEWTVDGISDITVVCSFLGRKPLMHLLVLPRENLWCKPLTGPCHKVGKLTSANISYLYYCNISGSCEEAGAMAGQEHTLDEHELNG